MQRDERRRAGGVEDKARPAQVEDVRNPVRENAHRIACHEPSIAARRVADPQIGIIVCRGADIDADRTIRELRRGDTCVFEGVPYQLQQDPLLRIHLFRFARRDAENGGVEEIDAIYQRSRPSVALARLAAVRMEVETRRPAGVMDLGNGIAPSGE